MKNEKHIATNIGNALYLGKSYTMPILKNSEFKEVLRNLRRDNITASDILMSGVVEVAK